MICHKIVVLVFVLVNLDFKVESIALEKFPQNGKILESVKEFVRMVDKYNLNVTVIGSIKNYAFTGWTKESVSLSWHIPLNKKSFKEPTLDDTKRLKYIEKIEKMALKEQVGARTRVIQFKDGEDFLADSQAVNLNYLIDSPNYDYLANYNDGESEFVLPKNETGLLIHNYIVKNPTDRVKKIEAIAANVVLNTLEISEHFPVRVLKEIEQTVKSLYLSIDDDNLLCRLLGDHLDREFDGDFQVLIGVDRFALGNNKHYVNLEVGNTNVLVFTKAHE